MDLGKKISTLRNKKGLNQRQMAEQIGVSNGAIAMWETNKRQPDLDTLLKLSEYFDVSTDYLLGISDNFITDKGKTDLIINPVTELEVVERITSVFRQLNVPFSQLNTILSCNYDKISEWIKGNEEPSKEELQILADYLNVPIELFIKQYNKCEPKTTFMDRLEFIMRTNQISEDFLCKTIGISLNEYKKWQQGISATYLFYIKELAYLLEVSEKYLLLDNVIAPGIEPAEDEYFLLLLYRAYKEGANTEYYSKLYDFFPNEALKDDNEKKLLNTFRVLNENNKIRGLSRLLDLEKEQEKENHYKTMSVAAEESNKDTMGKSLA